MGGYADTAKAARLLGWGPQLSLADGVRTSLAWRQKLSAVAARPVPRMRPRRSAEPLLAGTERS
jgi:hypothetical protein